jgi:hypothetical protein
MRQINPWMVSAARYGLRGGHFDPTPGAPPFVSGQARARASGQGCIAGSPQAMLLDHVRCRRLPGGPFGSPAPRGGHTGQIPAGRNALYLSYSPPFEALAQGVRRAPAKALKELNSGDVERLDCVSPLIMRIRYSHDPRRVIALGSVRVRHLALRNFTLLAPTQSCAIPFGS